jgi:Flp pilus assembly pilin Flp
MTTSFIDKLLGIREQEEGATITEYAAVIAAGAIAALALIALFRLVSVKLAEGAAWFGG